MTSQRFSSNKQAKRYDLKRSFRQLLVPSILMLLNFLYEFDYRPLTDNWDGTEYSKRAILVNLVSDYQSLLPFILILYGFLFAVVLFAPFMRKKNANFFFSSPVSRKDMYKNRAIAGVVSISAILFVTILIDVIINCVLLASDGFVIRVALVMLYESIMYSLVAFAFTSVAMCAANNLLEGIVLTGGLYFLPTGITEVIHLLSRAFLYGYSRPVLLADTVFVYGYQSDYVAPSLLQATAHIHPYLLGCKVGDFYKDIFDLGYQLNDISTKESPDMNYIAPLIGWTVAFALLMFVARYLFIHRKSENLGMVSKSKPIIAFLITEVALGISTAWIDLFSVSENMPKLARALVIVALFCISWYSLYSLFTKKIKHTKSAMAYFGTVAGALVVTICLLGGGLFGYSNYVPEVDDIKFASINGTGILPKLDGGYSSDDLFTTFGDGEGMAIFDDKADLEIFTDVNKKLIDGDRKTNNSITIVYELKNGKRIYRSYDYITAEGASLVPSLVDTKAYRNNLYYFWTGEGEDTLNKKTDKYNFGCEQFSNMFFLTHDRKDGIDVINLRFGVDDNDIICDDLSKEFIDEFKNAVVADYKNMTYKDIFFSDAKELGSIGVEISSYDNYPDMEKAYDYGTFVADTLTTVRVYPCMTNTISVLKKYNYYDELVQKTDKKYEEVYFAKLGEYGNMVRNETGVYVYFEEDNWYEAYNPREYGDIFQKSIDKSFIEKVYSIGQEYRFASDEDYLAVFVENVDGQIFQRKLIVPSNQMGKIL